MTAWSETFTFRAPYSEGVTKIALYGGVCPALPSCVQQTHAVIV